MASHLFLCNHSLPGRSIEPPLSLTDLQPFPESLFQFPNTSQTISNGTDQPKPPDASLSRHFSYTCPLLSSIFAPSRVQGIKMGGLNNNKIGSHVQNSGSSPSGGLFLVDHSSSDGLPILHDGCMQRQVRMEISSQPNISSLSEISNIQTQMSFSSVNPVSEGNSLPRRLINFMEPRYCYRRLLSSNSFYIGSGVLFRLEPYTADERKERIQIYRAKRNKRNYNKTIKYQCRKSIADARTRVRGRFVKNEEKEEISDITSLREKKKEEHLANGVEKEEQDLAQTLIRNFAEDDMPKLDF